MHTYEWSDWRNGMFWWLQSVYVLPEARGRGVFTSLFRHLEALAAADAGICGMRLYVERHNEKAQAVYRRLGLDSAGYEVFGSRDVSQG
jgi:ribosomal protein S18 acetylase RimI-like enzyme